MLPWTGTPSLTPHWFSPTFGAAPLNVPPHLGVLLIRPEIQAAWEAAIAAMPTPLRYGFLGSSRILAVDEADRLQLTLAVQSELAVHAIAPHATKLANLISEILGTGCELQLVIDPDACPRLEGVDDYALIEEALGAEVEQAREAGEIAYYARILAQVGLPYRRPPGNEFVRVNGFLRVSFTAPGAIGLPYGTLPRLLLCWVSTEAVTTKRRELLLGHTLTDFLGRLGLGRTGGARGDITRLRKQMTSLFGSTVTAVYQEPGHTRLKPVPFAEEAFLWWDPKRPDSPVFWNSTVLLSDPFFHSVIDRPVPIMLDALKQLRRSALAVDLYVWLAHRMFYLKGPTVIPTELLQAQFGTADSLPRREFRRLLKQRLVQVRRVWPELNVDVDTRGLILRPSPTPVRRLRSGRG